MLDEKEILLIVSSIHNWGKQHDSTKKKVYFSEVHKNISELRESVSYHADYNIFPEKLITSAAPNETEPEYKYRKANYKQITKPVWDKALAQTYRIWNKQNSHIKWKEEDYENYFNYEYPLYGSYPQFFQDVVHKMKFADPNAVLAAKPKFIPGAYNEGEFIVDQSEKVQPITELYSADQVFEYKEGEYTLLLTKYKSDIIIGNDTKKEGHVFELYDDMNIWQIIQVGKQNEWEFEAHVYYKHNWEAMPAWKLKGVRVYDPIETIYYSHFMCAVPNLDMAAVFNSTQFGVINKVAYPTRWYFEDECETCEGEGYTDFDGDRRNCTICKGSGKKFTFSWGKDFVIPMPKNLTDEDTTQLPNPPFGSETPSMDAPEFLDKKIERLLGTAFVNLNMDITEEPTGVSATEVKDDQENKYTFLVQITSEEYDLLQTSLDAQAYMRFGGKYESERIEVISPSEFSIRSSYELTEEYKTATEAKLPVIFQTKILEENIKQRFKGDTDMEKKLEVIIYSDPLMTKTDTEVIALVNAMMIPKWRAVLHTFAYQFIDELNKDGKWFDKKLEEKKKDLEDLAQTQAKELETRSAQEILKTIAQ